MKSDTVLTFLGRQRDQAVNEARKLVADAADGTRSTTPRWADEVEGALDDATRAADRLDRLAVTVGREPATYREDGYNSFFLDLAISRAGSAEADLAKRRLERHHREVSVEMERREVLTRRAFSAAAEPIGMTREQRDLTRVDGSGGAFVPPLWLIDQYATLPRAGRVLADRVTAVPLPAGTDSVSVPRITTGSATAVQTADNAAVQETDLVDAAVTAPVRTIAGQVDASVQLFEQAGAPGFDRIVFADLMADYATKLEAQLVAGTGALGQVTGLLTSPGTTVTYTSATPTVAATMSKIGDLASQVATARQMVPTLALLAPRRAFWLMSQADGQSRPMNPIDLAAPVRDANVEPVGSLLSMGTVLNPSIPTNLGAGTNEDRVIVTRAADHILLEGNPVLRVHLGVNSGTLTVRFGVHRYVAFISQRMPSATGVLVGTGLSTPTFA